MKIHKRAQNKAFTLVEILVVLSIIQVITYAAILNFQSISQYYRIYWFIRQVETDLLYAQEIAITSNRTVFLRFKTAEHEYFVIPSGGSQPVLRRTYDSSISLTFITLSPEIKFLNNGNISQSGSVEVSVGSLVYKLVFLLGKGRFYVKKL